MVTTGEIAEMVGVRIVAAPACEIRESLCGSCGAHHQFMGVFEVQVDWRVCSLPVRSRAGLCWSQSFGFPQKSSMVMGAIQ